MTQEFKNNTQIVPASAPGQHAVKALDPLQGEAPAANPERKTEQVNHPDHYNQDLIIHSLCDLPVECIDVAENFGFNLGNAIKYIWRAGDNGNFLQDLDKAVWYIQRAKSLYRKGASVPGIPEAIKDKGARALERE